MFFPLSKIWNGRGCLILFVASFYACAPRQSPQPRILLPSSQPLPSTAPYPGGHVTEPLSGPSAAGERIDQDPVSPSVDSRLPPVGETRGTTATDASLRDEGYLIAKITSGTPPQRAASLRLTEEGRRHIKGQNYTVALARLEKAITVDSRNPYGYFYLAQVHYYLNHYRESLNFLDVAESLLSGQSPWLAEVSALRRENVRLLRNDVKGLQWDPSRTAPDQRARDR